MSDIVKWCDMIRQLVGGAVYQTDTAAGLAQVMRILLFRIA